MTLYHTLTQDLRYDNKITVAVHNIVVGVEIKTNYMYGLTSSKIIFW
jgi:hypothetical protein